MPISKEQLASIISGHAKDLCSPENNRRMDSMKRNTNEGYDPDPSSFDGDNWDSMYLSTPQPSSRDIQYSQQSAMASKMPENIKQSMLNERIDTTALGEGSVLDSLGIKPTKKPQQKAMVSESKPQAPMGGIDYTALKAIIKECLNEYFEKLPLNESSSLKAIKLNGGTISLVDHSGNVYRAKLEFAGNKNNKQ